MNTMDHEHKIDTFSLRAIAIHYGRDAQVVKTFEELGAALSRYHAKPSDQHWNGLVEELADLQNMLDQLVMLFGFTAAVEQVRQAKILRQLSRIRLERLGGSND
ncbi:MAG: hypothetical protein Q3X95_03345 [Duodenibacillus sp.]|nr:hypothetical protein [Duodenibacillus sp.]